MQAHSVSLSSLPLFSTHSPFPFFSPISPSAASHYSPERVYLKAGAEARSRRPTNTEQGHWGCRRDEVCVQLQFLQYVAPLPGTLQCPMPHWPLGQKESSICPRGKWPTIRVLLCTPPLPWPCSVLGLWFGFSICVWFFLMTTKVTQAHWKKTNIKIYKVKNDTYNSIPRYIKLKSFRLIPLGFLHAFHLSSMYSVVALLYLSLYQWYHTIHTLVWHCTLNSFSFSLIMVQTNLKSYKL